MLSSLSLLLKSGRITLGFAQAEDKVLGRASRWSKSVVPRAARSPSNALKRLCAEHLSLPPLCFAKSTHDPIVG
jgi:hypothetical protein